MDVSRFADYIEIRELTARYNRAFDDGRIDEVVKTFTADGEFETQDFGLMPDPMRSGRNSRDSVTGGTHDRRPDHRVRRRYRDSGVRAAARKREQDRSTYRFVTTGRYRDTLVRTPDGWRFKHRYSSLDLGPAGLAGDQR